MEFYEKLIRLRKSRRMTQSDLAAVLGVSRQAVYKWECGQSYPEAMKLVSLKQLFGISIDDLLDPDYVVEAPLRVRKEKPRNTVQTAGIAENPPVGTADSGTVTPALSDEVAVPAEAPETSVAADTMPADDIPAVAETISAPSVVGTEDVVTDAADAVAPATATAEEAATAPAQNNAAAVSSPTPTPATSAETVSDATSDTAEASAPVAGSAASTVQTDRTETLPSDRKEPDPVKTPAAPPAKEEKPKKRSFFARLFGRK